MKRTEIFTPGEWSALNGVVGTAMHYAEGIIPDLIELVYRERDEE